MDTSNTLAERFDDNRARLRALALRMLGSASEADDAVQEAWLKLARTALVGGQPGAVWAVQGQVRAAFAFTVAHDKIVGIDLIMDPAHLAELNIQLS